MRQPVLRGQSGDVSMEQFVVHKLTTLNTDETIISIRLITIGHDRSPVLSDQNEDYSDEAESNDSCEDYLTEVVDLHRFHTRGVEDRPAVPHTGDDCCGQRQYEDQCPEKIEGRS